MLVGFCCFLAVSAAKVAKAESRFDSLFSPGNSAEVAVSFEPSNNGKTDVFTQEAGGSAILRQHDGKTWTALGRASRTRFTDAPRMPETGILFPDILWDTRGGLSFSNKLGDRHQWGGQFSIGSASDHLFHSIHETEIQATGSLMKPSGQQNAWIYFLNYSNNRAFLNNVPLPGFAYMWRLPQKSVQIIAGFPFVAINYNPKNPWSARASLFGPTNQSLEVAYRISTPLQIYLGYERSPVLWLRANREDNAKRLIYDEKKIVLGIRNSLGKKITIDLAGGRNFDRHLFEAKDADKSAPKASLRSGWIGIIKLSTRW